MPFDPLKETLGFLLILPPFNPFDPLKETLGVQPFGLMPFDPSSF
jgi:hypothetical protein